MIARNIQRIFPAYMKQFPVILLTGARQVGKTTLLRNMFPDMTYLTLDDHIQAAKMKNSPEDFFGSINPPVIIDEARYAPSIFRHMKLVVDKTRKKGQYILTGSQIFPLMQNVTESLAGRCGVINLDTLSAMEILNEKGDIDIDDYIMKGGFPALHSGDAPDADIWYSSYISTYIERDVRNILAVTNLRDFSRFMRILALRTGQILSLSSIANDTGIAPNTVKSWISVLQASGHICLLEPYFNNMGKRIVKTPKMYFRDTGLALHLIGLTKWQDVDKTPLAEAIWETYVFSQLYKFYLNRGTNNPPLWFWRSQSGHEVDFLVDFGGRFIAIESKLTGSPSPVDGKNFQYLEKFYGDGSVMKKIIACRVKEPYPLDREIVAHNFLSIEKILRI